MKKLLKPLLLTGLVLLLLLASWIAYMIGLNRQASQQLRQIEQASDTIYSATLVLGVPADQPNPYEALTFKIETERDVQLHIWGRSLAGSVSLAVLDAEGQSVFEAQAGRPAKAYPLHLKAGQYRILLHSSNAFAAGCIVGVNYSSAYLAQLRVLPDTDRDGLPDDLEALAGTDPQRADTDGDTLSDYAERVKYGTDPRKADSDSDGVADDDWSERRGYAYTVRVVLRLRPPFDLAAMNDLYQDVRVTAEVDAAGYTTLEAILYPETRAVLSASAYPLEALPAELQSGLEPGIATNYDQQMQSEVLDIVAGSTTDVQAAARIVKWVNTETSLYLDYSIPEVYFTYLDGGQVKVRNYSYPFPAEELLRTHYFAASMFRARTHGTCTSIATLKCAMLKAAGIPCRSIQTLFPIYYHGSQTEPYTNNLHRKWEGCSYEQPAGDDLTYANHAFMEVYLGGQWVRGDNDFGIFYQGSDCLALKFVSVTDWSEVDFSETWPVDWIRDRPYYTILIEDQEPRNSMTNGR